jgi:hypothetical protein
LEAFPLSPDKLFKKSMVLTGRTKYLKVFTASTRAEFTCQ